MNVAISSRTPQQALAAPQGWFSAEQICGDPIRSETPGLAAPACLSSARISDRTSSLIESTSTPSGSRNHSSPKSSRPALARAAARGEGPFQKPCVILSGGETTVTVRGSGGRGGRASEFLAGLPDPAELGPDLARAAVGWLHLRFRGGRWPIAAGAIQRCSV